MPPAHDILGTSAAALSLVAFIPYLFKVLRTGRTDDLSLGTFVCTSLALAMWSVYGVLIGASAFAAANGLTALLAAGFLISRVRGDLLARRARNSSPHSVRWSIRGGLRHRARFAAVHERPAGCWFSDPAHDWGHGEAT